MNAVACMEDMCLQGGQAYIVRTWVLPQYEVKVHIATTGNALYAAWGLQKTVAASIEGGFWPIVGRYFWRGQSKGHVDIGYRSISDNITEVNQGDINLVYPDLSINATGGIGTTLEAPQLEIVPHYRGLPMTARQVFGTALGVMVAGAEGGPENPCPGFANAEFEVEPELDAQGQPLLEYRQLIKAMKILTRWMVAKRYYAEIDIKLRRDGLEIAQARLKQPASTASR
ncbi:hypothetical protein MMC28_005534 [Mycoblastus sanguinarius]|nr:hypothetical protein [Mycoblastus sanguinarius]